MMRNRMIWLFIVVSMGLMVFGSTYAAEGDNLLTNGDFETGLYSPWGGYGDYAYEVVQQLEGAAVPDGPIEGDYCLHVTVPAVGANPWDAGIQTWQGQVFEAGKKYTLSAFFKSKSGPMNINFKPELAQDPWTGYGEAVKTINEEWAEYSVTTPVFAADTSPTSITFHIAATAGEFWMDNVKFYEGDYIPTLVLPKFVATNPVPADGVAVPPITEGGMPPYMILDYIPGANAVSHEAWFSDNINDVITRNGAHSLGSPPWPELDEQAYYVGFDCDPIPAFARVPLAYNKTYYWVVDEFDGTTTWPGYVWSFFVMPAEAWGPTPEDGDSLILGPGVTLTWHLGDLDTEGKAVSYDVYFGT
ncbi:MAG: carbohydrate binding domain-containing protein, partial [Sedimentisphaerales bacterium]|nr:carbohydrate binding domain-containing protein [Sedimentisphaerales bacterium]